MVIDYVLGGFSGAQTSWAEKLRKRARSALEHPNLPGCHAVKCGVVDTNPYPGPSPDPDPTFYWRPISSQLHRFRPPLTGLRARIKPSAT